MTRRFTKRQLFVSCLALCVPAAAAAAEPGHVQAYIIPSTDTDIDTGGADGDYDGDGYGVNAFVPLGAQKRIVLTGQYQFSNMDDVDADIDEYRLGGGVQMGSERLSAGLFAEWLNFEAQETGVEGLDDHGYGVHARVATRLPWFGAYAQVGYLDLDGRSGQDPDGPEYLAGIEVRLTPNMGAFVDFRYTDLSGGSLDFEREEFRTGLRYNFGI